MGGGQTEEERRITEAIQRGEYDQGDDGDSGHEKVEPDNEAGGRRTMSDASEGASMEPHESTEEERSRCDVRAENGKRRRVTTQSTDRSTRT